jgi:hypothetical protein
MFLVLGFLSKRLLRQMGLASFLFWPGEVEGLSAVMGIDMAVEECAVASAAEFVACRCVMEACDSIPERPDAIGPRLDQYRISTDLA